MHPSVKLISWTARPMETIFLLWEASRKKDKLPTMQELMGAQQKDPELKARIRDTFLKVLSSHIPISENINFVFLLENVSVAFREQMVRHRVGCQVGARVGFDMIPELHDSTWWSQTMRVINMGDFANDDAYHTPQSIEENEKATEIYHDAMYNIEAAYNRLCDVGIPPEDARMVIPMAAQHRISWGLNLATLAHIITSRSCWIAQLGLWEPVILGMLDEVCTKVDPIFSVLATPPCMNGDVFKGCLHEIDSEARCSGKDPGIPCALYLGHTNPNEARNVRTGYAEMCSKFEKFWRRDVNTGQAKISQ